MTTPESSSSLISPSQVHTSQAEVLLLDVRTPGEYASAHIEGAVLHPLDRLDPAAVTRLAAGKTGTVVVCQSGKRAAQAAEKLKAAGLSAVAILEGGVNAWEAAGLPLTRGQGVISLERQVRIAAGTLVLTGALLGFFVHPGWIALSGFVGAGLIFAGITDTCGMGMLLARMPWNQGGNCGSCCSIRK